MKKDDVVTARRRGNLKVLEEGCKVTEDCKIPHQPVRKTANSQAQLNTVSETRATDKPRGIPTSGRCWKQLKTKRYNAIMFNPNRCNFEEKMKKKANRKAVKDFAKELQDERKAQLEAAKKATEEKKKRKLENERKSEIVVPITDPQKLKRLKKTSYRMIEKR